MRLLTYDDIEHKLTESEWRKLVRSFDARKARLSVIGYDSINVSSICEDRDYKCVRCPLNDPRKRINSCTFFFRNIIGEELFLYLHLFDFAVIWDQKYDTEARSALKKVSVVLNQAKKV